MVGDEWRTIRKGTVNFLRVAQRPYDAKSLSDRRGVNTQPPLHAAYLHCLPVPRMGLEVSNVHWLCPLLIDSVKDKPKESQPAGDLPPKICHHALTSSLTCAQPQINSKERPRRAVLNALIQPGFLERAKGFEPSTPTLARCPKGLRQGIRPSAMAIYLPINQPLNSY